MFEGQRDWEHKLVDSIGYKGCIVYTVGLVELQVE